MRRLLIGFVLLAAMTACGGDDGETAAGDTTTTTAATTTTDASPSSTSTTSVDGIDPMEGAGTDPVRSDGPGTGTALLTDVRVARHEGFDRVVFEFQGNLPGYTVEYVQPPITEDGSGDEVDVDGDAFLSITMTPASGFDLSGEGEQTYDGPTRIAGEEHGTSVIREVVRTGDFEAVLGWVVGLSDRVDFRVDEVSSPPRLVIDVRNH
jgi:hypothetical protein